MKRIETNTIPVWRKINNYTNIETDGSLFYVIEVCTWRKINPFAYTVEPQIRQTLQWNSESSEQTK